MQRQKTISEKYSLLSISLVLFLAFINLSAQNIFSPMSAAKAHASVGSANGLDAIFTNPAGIDNSFEQEKLEISVYNLGGKIGSTYLNSSELKKVFGFGGNNSAERSELATLLEDEKLYLNFGVNLLTAKYSFENAGSIGLNIGTRLYGRLKFDENLINLIETSNIGKQDYLIINKGVGGAWTREFGLSYSKKIILHNDTFFPEIRFGITPKFITGVATLELDPNSVLSINQVNVRGSAGFRLRGGFVASSAQAENFDLAAELASFTTNFFPAGAGFGIGLNVGVQAVLLKSSKDESSAKLVFGAMLQDYGTINWDKTYSRKLMMLDDTITTGVISNEKFQQYAGELVKGETFSTKLPSSLRLGLCGQINMLSLALINLDFETEIPLVEIGGNYTNPRFSLGGNMSVRQVFNLGTGFSFGGNDNFGYGLGVGYFFTKSLRLDLATSALNKLFSGNQYDLSARMSYLIY